MRVGSSGGGTTNISFKPEECSRLRLRVTPLSRPALMGALSAWIPTYLREGCKPVSRDFDLCFTLRQTTGKTCH
jgi:hypothetical protein